MVLSFLCVGSFEALGSPASLFFVGGHQQSPLSEWEGRRMLRLEGIEWEGDNRTALGEKLVLETTERNARMVTGWQMCATTPAMSLVNWD